MTNSPFKRIGAAIAAGFAFILVIAIWPQLMPIIDWFTAELVASASMSPTETFLMIALPYIILIILMAGFAWLIWQAVKGQREV